MLSDLKTQVPYFSAVLSLRAEWNLSWNFLQRRLLVPIGNTQVGSKLANLSVAVPGKTSFHNYRRLQLWKNERQEKWGSRYSGNVILGREKATCRKQSSLLSSTNTIQSCYLILWISEKERAIAHILDLNKITFCGFWQPLFGYGFCTWVHIYVKLSYCIQDLGAYFNIVHFFSFKRNTCSL